MPEQATLLNPPNNEPGKTRWGPALLSAVSHILLLVFLFLVISRVPPTTGGEPDRAGEIVLAIVDDKLDTTYFKHTDDSRDSEVPPPTTAITTDPPPAVEFQLPEPSPLPGPAPSQLSQQASKMTAGTTGRHPETPYELSDEDLEMIEAEQKLIRDRRPKGSEATISVFGSGDLTGRKFVFLIDRSKSMGDQGLGVLKQARIELSQAINLLQDHHYFQVVVYHNSTGTIGRRELLPATSENKQRVPEFLQSLMAFGGTDHELGLYSAMAFDPDVIVVMTDGGSPNLNDGQLNTIKKTARNTQIHTLQFGLGAARESNHFLERLSMKTSGTYRYVDVRSWRTK